MVDSENFSYVFEAVYNEYSYCTVIQSIKPINNLTFVENKVLRTAMVII